MGKRKMGIDLHHGKYNVDDDDDDDEELGLLLSEIQRNTISRHRSRSLHIAALVHGVQGKVTKKVMVETKEKFEHSSPCLSNTLAFCMSSKRREKGPPIPREKMGNFTFDDHLEEIWRGLSEDKKPSFALLDSMCFLFYNDGRGHSLDLIKSKDIFSKKYALVPIVCWNHWRLVIFCHFGQSTYSKTKTRCILLLDSMGMGAREIEPDLRKFVFDIFKAEGRPEIKDVVYQIPILVPKVPQQRNDVDCGRFVLYFIKKFMDDAPDNFSHVKGYPYFMRWDWFTSDNFEDFCDKLKKESPPHTPGKTAEKRRSQRIQNKRTLQRPPPRTGSKTVFSRESSKAEMEVVLID